jgi:hypothetical protein
MRDTAIVKDSPIENAIIYSFLKLSILDQPTKMQMETEDMVETAKDRRVPSIPMMKLMFEWGSHQIVSAN